MIKVHQPKVQIQFKLLNFYKILCKKDIEPRIFISFTLTWEWTSILKRRVNIIVEVFTSSCAIKNTYECTLTRQGPAKACICTAFSRQVVEAVPCDNVPLQVFFTCWLLFIHFSLSFHVYFTSSFVIYVFVKHILKKLYGLLSGIKISSCTLFALFFKNWYNFKK